MYEFGRFRLDVDEHLLVSEGKPVRLTEKEFQLLVCLVRHAGHLLMKEELLEALWPGVFVEEGNLTKQVSNLRKCLGQDDSGQHFIETVPKRGFRFVARVTKVEAESTPTEQRETSRRTKIGKVSRWPAMVVGALLVVSAVYWGVRRAGERSTPVERPLVLAVLPLQAIAFENTEDRNLGYGITDALITRLSALEQVRLRPSSAVRTHIGQPLDAIAIGRELGADSVLEGIVQQKGDRVRISVRLLAVREGAPQWAERFDQELTDLFALEEAIAEKVVSSLDRKLTNAEQERLRRKYTRDPLAYRAYLNGRASLMKYSREATLEAVGWFEAALQRDPDFTLARAGLARASAEMYLRFASESELDGWATRSEQEARAALALEPNLAETHEALAAVYRKKDFNWEATIAESQKALELNPHLDQPHFYLAAAYYHLGLFELAEGEAQRASELAPENRTDRLRTEAVIALYRGHYQRAATLLEEVQRISSRPLSDPHLAHAYYYLGQIDRARTALDLLLDSPSASTAARGQAFLAAILAARGERARALELLKLVEQKKYLDHHVAYSIGAAYAQLGNTAEAVAFLRKAVEMGLACYPWFEKDPLLNPLRTKTEFRRFMEEFHSSWKQLQQKYPS
ncbi:MAG: winged helix-turn-helix domain-containing protein [Firmicutes bacterium]|nr:winged helix-turn-helix domain-containing protein [Bacillota bacterium]